MTEVYNKMNEVIRHPAMTRDNFLNLAELAMVWLLFIAWFIGVPRLSHQAIWLALTAVFSLALQQYFSGVQHEAAHGCFLLGNRRWNDRIANWFASYLFSYPVSAYRTEHFRHHENTLWFVPDDKETAPRAGPRSTFLRGIMKDLFFVSAAEMFVIRNSIGGGKSFLHLLKDRLPVLIHFGALWGCLVYFGSPLYMFVYFLTFFTLYLLSNRIRGWGTHGDLYKEEGIMESTVARNVMSPWYERVFVGNRMMMYHFEHHQMPELSFRQCERKAKARTSFGTKKYNIQAPSYLFFVRHFCARTFISRVG